MTTRSALARMIGNAVPPLLGLDIGRLVVPLFSSSSVASAPAQLRRAA
jgi:hypothetical protein